MPYPKFTSDLAYNETKAKAEEAVLAANGKNGLLTVAIRPAGIFGYVPHRQNLTYPSPDLQG